MKREGFTVIGKDGLRDKQSIECVTGRIEMADDVFLGQKLFAAQLGTPHAHCKVVSIDASAALALDGVEAVMDHTEIPGWSEEKFYVGAPVACVAATSQNIAMRALELIDVEYEERPAVIDPEEAMESGAPLTGLWPESNTNERTNFTRDGTDLDAGFAEATGADIEVDIGYTNNHDNHSIGGGNSTCWWNGDELYEWTCTQNVHGTARGLAGAFDLPLNKVHGYTFGSGAGFGGGRAAVQVQCAALARKTGKAVSFHIDRKQQFETSIKQFATKSKIRLGAKEDGTMTAVDFQYWTDQGMGSRSPMTGTHQCFQHAFPIPNFHAVGIGISTNTVARSYYRCVAHPGGAFHMNIALNKLADELGMDPCELRLKNFAEPGLPANDRSPEQPYSLDTLKKIFEEVMEEMDWEGKYHPNGQNNVMSDGRLHGIAITGHRDGHGGMGGGRGASLHMRRDGTCFMNPGMSRTGCGTNSAIAHIVAERLGIHYDDVTSNYGMYHISVDGGMQAGSTNTTRHGAAYYVAASDAREQILAIAAGMFEPAVNPEELDAADRKVFKIADPTQFLAMEDVCSQSAARRIVGSATDNWGSTLTREHYGYPVGHPGYQMPPCVSGVEVAVDPETGEIEILKLVYLTDVGRVLFKDGAYGQAEAGCDHVIAQAIYWDVIWDKSTGYMLNSNFWQSRMPTSLDLPIDTYSPLLAEGDSAVAPYGGTGMGEPVSGNHNTVSLAVSNAIGTYITEGPLNPWTVLKAMGKV